MNRVRRFFERLRRSRKGASEIVASIVGIFVAILVGAALLEPMAYEVSTSTTGNLSTFTSAVSIVNLVPLFFGMLILAAAVAEVMRRL